MSLYSVKIRASPSTGPYKKNRKETYQQNIFFESITPYILSKMTATASPPPIQMVTSPYLAWR